MERRHFLRWSGASFVSLSAYPWLTGCSGRTKPESKTLEQDPEKAIELDFAACVARARAMGKPVLVFLAPTAAEMDGRDARNWFADFLMSADDGLWRDLALCELACASIEEVGSAIPSPRLARSAQFAFIEHGPSGPWIAERVEQPLGERQSNFASREDWLRAERIRFAGWTAAIHRLVAADPAGLRRRAKMARAALGPEIGSRADECVRSSETPDASLLSCATALLLQAAADQPQIRGRFETMVVDSARSRVLARGFSGAGWGHDLGCGSNIEESPRPSKTRRKNEDSGILCGMAFVDEYSDRFLWFYTDEAR